MNYYPHHIGDFNNATRHLTRVERALYRDLIELYYDTEAPFLAKDYDRICKKVLALTVDEKNIVEALLREFFTLEDGIYRHERCDKEIAVYKNKLQIASKAGRASAQRRVSKRQTPVERESSGRSTTVQPTKNQEPRTKEQSAQRSRGSRLPADWKPDDTLSAWAAKERPDLDLDTTLARFRDHWAAAPGARGVKLDWAATYRNWVRNEKPGARLTVSSAPPPTARAAPCDCGAPGTVKVGGKWRCGAHVREEFQPAARAA